MQFRHIKLTLCNSDLTQIEIAVICDMSESKINGQKNNGTKEQLPL
jgi:DNA-binding CsgD family transcriptional regulator